MSSHQKSLSHLSKNDPVLARVIRLVKVKPLKPRKNHFQSLATSIVNQQLSGKAAKTILARFEALFKGSGFPKLGQVLKITNAKMRDAGLSLQKISYIKGLAEAVNRGEIDCRKLIKLSDEEIIIQLTKIKGIGRWTAEMFLMFSLGRPDVFSHGDLGLRNAIKKLYNFKPHPKHKKLQKLLQAWHPYKTSASRHLWASLKLKD